MQPYDLDKIELGERAAYWLLFWDLHGPDCTHEWTRELDDAAL